MKPAGQGTRPPGARPPVEARLQALFGALDTSADFEESVLARVKVEASAALDRKRIERARMEESRRYGQARSELSWGNTVRELWTTYFSRWVTLESIGVAVLVGFVLRFAWSRLPPEWTEQIYAPEMFGVLGLALAAAPLAAFAISRYRRRLTLADPA